MEALLPSGNEVENIPPTSKGHEYLQKLYDPENPNFWIDRRTIKVGNFYALLAICPEREEPRLFLQKVYKQGEETTKFSISLQDANALCEQMINLLAEIDSVGYGNLPASLLKFPEYAGLDPREAIFWDKKVTWATASDEVRCRILVKSNGEKYIIVNSPRDIAELKNWRGPTFW